MLDGGLRSTPPTLEMYSAYPVTTPLGSEGTCQVTRRLVAFTATMLGGGIPSGAVSDVRTTVPGLVVEPTLLTAAMVYVYAVKGSSPESV